MSLLVPVHPGSPGQRAVKRSVCVCACVHVIVLALNIFSTHNSCMCCILSCVQCTVLYLYFVSFSVLLA